MPEKHWYNWNNSSSRIISNGCHWIDHFLFLNDFVSVKDMHAHEASDKSISVFIELFNGAVFTMLLTDIGGSRVGVQDYIELRANSVTVRITNGSLYKAENDNKIIRSKKVNKIFSYKNMYRSIGSKILNNDKGDSWTSIYISSCVMLSVNNSFK